MTTMNEVDELFNDAPEADFSTTAFGDHSSQPDVIEEGLYDATVKKIDLVRDRETGQIKETDNGKKQVDVSFALVDDPEIVIRRRMSISFGQNSQTKQYSVFSQFIAATTGIPSGDKRQQQATPQHVIGKPCRIFVTISQTGYNNIDKIGAPSKPKAQAKPAPSGFDDTDIPF